MSVSPSLQRLLSLREAEERQKLILMETALAELNRLAYALNQARRRGTAGHALVSSGVQSGESIDRIAGLEEVASAERIVVALTNRIKLAENAAARFRQEFLAKRIERRQVGALLDAMKEQENLLANRKGQSTLDDWYRMRHARRIRDPDRMTMSTYQEKA